MNIFKRTSKAYKEVASTEAGKIMLADLYKAAGITKNPYVVGDSYGTTYNVALKSFAERIKKILNQSDEDVENLIKHHNSLVSSFINNNKQ